MEHSYRYRLRFGTRSGYQNFRAFFRGISKTSRPFFHWFFGRKILTVVQVLVCIPCIKSVHKSTKWFCIGLFVGDSVQVHNNIVQQRLHQQWVFHGLGNQNNYSCGFKWGYKTEIDVYQPGAGTQDWIYTHSGIHAHWGLYKWQEAQKPYSKTCNNTVKLQNT